MSMLAVSPHGSSNPKRVDRANTNDRPKEWNDEFCAKARKKLALDPSVLMASLMSTVLKVPRVASPGLSRRSRAYVMPNPETSVGWLYSGISSGLIVLEIFETSTRL